MRHLVLGAAAVALFLAVLSSPAAAQLTINGGNPIIAVTGGVAGSELPPVVNTTCTLRWRRENVVTKITVSSSCPGQHFTFRVVATNVSHGIAAPEVPLTASVAGVDFITNIPAGNPPWKTATLQYTAAPTFDQGNSDELGTDQNQVTYTLVAQ